VTISPLADLPDAIQTLAKWFYDEWHAFDGRSIESIGTQLGDYGLADSLPYSRHHRVRWIRYLNQRGMVQHDSPNTGV